MLSDIEPLFEILQLSDLKELIIWGDNLKYFTTKYSGALKLAVLWFLQLQVNKFIF